MKFFLAALLGLVPQQPPPCDAIRQKTVELRKDTDAWLVRHVKDCPLCSAGSSSCREGFERQDLARRQLDDWKKGHLASCPSCTSARCKEVENNWAHVLSVAEKRHKELDKKCDLDPARCDSWKRLLEAEKARHDEWKRDHPALCDKCGSSCEEWRKRVQEVNLRAVDAANKHRDKCQDCQRNSGCERAGLVKQEWTRDRLAAWKKHADACSCGRPDKRR